MLAASPRAANIAAPSSSDDRLCVWFLFVSAVRAFKDTLELSDCSAAGKRPAVSSFITADTFTHADSNGVDFDELGRICPRSTAENIVPE